MACGIKTLQSIKKTTENQKPITFIERFSHKPSALPSKTIKQFDIQSNNLVWKTTELSYTDLLWQKKFWFFIRS